MNIFDHVLCKVIIIKNDHEFSFNFTFDIFERMNFQFSFLQRDLINAYFFVVIFDLINNQMSSLTRHRKLKKLIRRQTNDMYFFKQNRKYLYSIIHLNRFFNDVVLHLNQTIKKSFEFLRSNSLELFFFVKTHDHFRNFFDFNCQFSVEKNVMIKIIAFAILLNVYLVESHNESLFIFEVFFI